MPQIEEKFDQDRVDGLKRYLQREASKNRKKDFEIVVDGFKVVSRTNNVDEFDEYEQELRNDTSSLSILIYDGPTTNRNTKHSFYFNDERTTNRKAVNGLGSLGEIDQLVQMRIDENNRDHMVAKLREDLERTQDELDQALEYNETLEQTVNTLKSKKLSDNNNLGDLLNAFIGSIVKSNASKLPGGEMLAGLFAGAETEKQPIELLQEGEPSKVTFKKQKPADEPDEMTQNRMALIADLQKKLNELQMVGLFSIIEHLTTKPEQIQTVIEILNDK